MTMPDTRAEPPAASAAPARGKPPALQPVPLAPGQRDLRLDFFRGLALLCIFIDHIPGNRIADYTIRNIGLSDASELFIFISGYAAGLVYMAAVQREGFLFSGLRVWRRVWQLYVAHLFLFVIFTAEVAWSSMKFDNPMYVEEMNIASFLNEPHIAILEALLLKFKPVYMDILPLYIVLLAFFPFALWLITKSRLLTLALSCGIYFTARYYHINLPAYPEDAEWFFNPLAWQLLFVIGAILGASMRRSSAQGTRFPVPRSPWLLALAVAYALFGFTMQFFWEHGWIELLPTKLEALIFPTDKTNLSGWRFVNLLALAYITTYFLRADSAMLRWRAMRPLILCGQNSLHVFCLGVFLSFAGLIVLVEFGASIAYQLLINAAGLALMVVAAALLAWYRAQERLPRKPAEVKTGDVKMTPTALGGGSAE
ncbi:MAG TPA: OpgC domain-containing protein [Alphaproteobacteria bacterium]|nr:OpgC domain-containing protein [Alphaproteobacteria bacterium]